MANHKLNFLSGLEGRADAMGRPFIAETQSDPRCVPVLYDAERPITPDAFALPNPAVRLLWHVADTAAAEYAELGYYQFEAVLRGNVERLRSMVACDRSFAEAAAGMLYLVAEAHLKAGRDLQDAFWDRLLDAFANHMYIRIKVVRHDQDTVVLKVYDEDEVACTPGGVVAFMGGVYHDYNTRPVSTV